MSFYPEFEQEPSKPHQCVFYNDDGVRCRSYAMRNEYTCYHHQNVDMPHVVSNDAFPLEPPKDRVSIQNAISDVLTRLAANQMDIRRAGILLYGLQIASSNLSPHTAVAEASSSSSASSPSPGEPSAAPQGDAESGQDRERFQRSCYPAEIREVVFLEEKPRKQPLPL